MAEVHTTGVVAKTFKHDWKIQNWTFIESNPVLFDDQKFIFETGHNGATEDIKSKWMVYLEPTNSKDYLRVVWKLLDLDPNIANIKAKVLTGIYDKPHYGVIITEKHKTFCLNEKIICDICHKFSPNTNLRYGVDGADTLTINVDLTLLEAINPPETPTTVESYIKPFMTEMSKNQAVLLNDSSTADLKIISSDGQEFTAHRLILQARCPYFAAMFRSGMSEATNGILNLKDVTGKTMSIILHFFYTAELLPSWSDEDTVLEFTYAAGKFQMTTVLQMLDEVLGTGKADVSHLDIQLLSLTQKLSLKNAETKLLKRVIRLTTKVTSGEELFALFANK